MATNLIVLLIPIVSSLSDSRKILTVTYTEDPSRILSDSYGPWGDRLESYTSDDITQIHTGGLLDHPQGSQYAR